MLALILAIVLAQTSPQAPAQPAGGNPPAGHLIGRVTDARSNQPLADVIVQVESSGERVLTDADGRFDLPAVAPGPQRLLISVVGYALGKKDVVVDATGQTDVAIPMSETGSAYTEEVTVSAGAFAQVETGVAGQAVLGARQLQELRVLIVDDPYRAIQALPGVSTANDFRSEFAVRGTGPDRLEMSVDGMDTPLLFHAVRGVEGSGSLAMVGTDIVQSASLASGARPQRNAAHLGPSVELTTRDGATDRLHVKGLASATTISTVWEGPVGSGERASWMVAARKSYVDWLVQKVAPSVDVTFGFTDAAAKLTWFVSPRQSIRFSTIAGTSTLHETSPGVGGIERGFDGKVAGNLQWRYEPSARLVLGQQLYVVEARYENNVPDGRVRQQGSDTDVTWKGSLTWAPSDRLTVESGARAETTSASRLNRSISATANTLISDTSGHAGMGSAWANVKWAVSSRLMLTPGARVDHWGISDETKASPWMLAEWQPAAAWKVRGGGGVQRQAPTVEQATLAVVGKSLTAERAEGVDVGLERTFGPQWRATVATYYRREFNRLRQLGEPQLVKTTVQQTRPARWVNEVDGDARGLELSVERKSVNGVSGWISYAFAKTALRDEVRGESFVSDYDQPHTFSAYASYRWSNRTSVSADLRLGSNFPLVGYYRTVGADFYAGTDRNAIRLPKYRRMDLRADRTFTYRRSRLTLFVECLNVLGTTNVAQFNPSVTLSTGLVKNATQTLLPLLPSAGVMIEF